jgi:hypothetical protein
VTYIELISKLAQNGFTRIERDDRLLDVFPTEITDKGIELWERWEATHISLVRLHLPFRPKFVKYYRIPRSTIETALYQNKTKQLSRFKTVPTFVY